MSGGLRREAREEEKGARRGREERDGNLLSVVSLQQQASLSWSVALDSGLWPLVLVLRPGLAVRVGPVSVRVVEGNWNGTSGKARPTTRAAGVVLHLPIPRASGLQSSRTTSHWVRPRWLAVPILDLMLNRADNLPQYPQHLGRASSLGGFPTSWEGAAGWAGGEEGTTR